MCAHNARVHAFSSRWICLVRFPDYKEQKKIAARSSFPGFVGAVDGSHIPIVKPPERDEPVEYINRHGYCSILLQVVADDRCIIRSVCAVIA